MSKLVGSNEGPMLLVDNNSAADRARALELRVEPGKAPMKVNSAAKVAKLHADRLDGKSANEIGVNGLERVSFLSASNSNSPKLVTAHCPAGKVAVGTGAQIFDGKRGRFPNTETDIGIDGIIPSFASVSVQA